MRRNRAGRGHRRVRRSARGRVAEVALKGARASKRCSRAVEKAKVSADMKIAIVNRIVAVNGPADFGECDLVVEAATENIDLKLSSFVNATRRSKSRRAPREQHVVDLDHQARGATKRPDRVIGMHFMNPPP